MCNKIYYVYLCISIAFKCYSKMLSVVLTFLTKKILYEKKKIFFYEILILFIEK